MDGGRTDRRSRVLERDLGREGAAIEEDAGLELRHESWNVETRQQKSATADAGEEGLGLVEGDDFGQFLCISFFSDGGLPPLIIIIVCL